MNASSALFQKKGMICLLDWIKFHKLHILVGIGITIVGIFLLFPSVLSPFAKKEENTWILSEEIETETTLGDEIELEDKELTLIVDVKGAVRKPGVYEAQDGERVIDLIEKAGGLLKTANELEVNFAMKVSDEMVLYIPFQGDENITVGQLTSVVVGTSEGGKINLNTATEKDLLTLPGIGPSKASLIIQYREENGSYKVIEDLMSVSGIGEKTFEKLKESITVR